MISEVTNMCDLEMQPTKQQNPEKMKKEEISTQFMK